MPCCNLPRRTTWCPLLAAGVLLWLAPSPGIGEEATGSRPNIVLVMADDQGWGDMAYNGHQHLRTPHFDRLAAEGLRCDRFYAAAPLCSPTRGSVLTGRNPNRFGCFSAGHSLRPQELTLAEALQRAGYRTGHFGKWHLGSVRRGSPVNPGASGFDRWLSAENFFDQSPILSREGVATPQEGDSSEVTVDAAIEFIRRAAAEEQPFLAVVWFGSPHVPHEALAEDRQVYADLPERLQNFYGEITAMDRAFGRLRSEIRALGIRNNTLLWYTSDNGALPRVGSTGGHRGRKGDLYEGGLLVPALVEWPAKIDAPTTTDVRCTTSDIYPTVLAATGVEVDHQPPLDGINLLPLFAGEMSQRPQPIGFWRYPEPGIRTPSAEWMADLLEAQQQGREPDDPEKLRLDAGQIAGDVSETELPGHAAWIDGRWKLHRLAERGGREVNWELYDLAEDPTESNDISGEQLDRLLEMKQALESWQRSVVRSLNGDDY